MKLSDTGVGVSYVAWKIAGGECFARGVLPGAGEGIVCVDKFKTGTGGEGGQAAATREHAVHVCHLTCIK